MLEHEHDSASIRARLTEPARQSYLKDGVFGAIDGAVTTFAIVAGVVGANLSLKVIVALGIANVLGDGFSIAAGNYSGTKAELADARRLRAIEERHIQVVPEGERAELREILAQKGLSGEVLDAATDAIAENREAWIDMMLVEEYGLSPVDPHPLRAGIATFAAFLLAGMVPLLPYLIGAPSPFTLSIWATGITFFTVGAIKAKWSLTPWWRSGLETLAIGGSAAVIAYGVGTLFRV